MPRIHQASASSRPNPGFAALALILAAVLLCTLMPASAGAGLNPLKSREIVAKHIWKHVRKLVKVRTKCGQDIEKGNKPWTVDCSQDPVASGGTGTGDADVDADLQHIYDKAASNKKYLRLRTKGTPSENGVSQMCSPASDIWASIDTCVSSAYSGVAKTLFALYFDPAPRSVGSDEQACRGAIGRKLSGLYKRMLKARTSCFNRNGLLGDGSFATLFDCRAVAVPPGLGRPSTGRKSVDDRVEQSYVQLRSVIFSACPDALGSNGFPGNLTDPTGGVMGRIDLYQIMMEGLLGQVQVVLDGLYAGEEACGDGILDAALGEECDDGNRINCDGCDSNCTLPACGNAVGCAATGEQCDDGDTNSEDGCTPACILEYCGDGTVQAGLGEDCDDGNNTNGDGCSSTCAVE